MGRAGDSLRGEQEPLGQRAATTRYYKAIPVPQVSRFKVCLEGLQTKRILFRECLCDAVWCLEIESLFYGNKERVRGGLTCRVLSAAIQVSCTSPRPGGLGASSILLLSGIAGTQTLAF